MMVAVAPPASTAAFPASILLWTPQQRASVLGVTLSTAPAFPQVNSHTTRSLQTFRTEAPTTRVCACSPTIYKWSLNFTSVCPPPDIKICPTCGVDDLFCDLIHDEGVTDLIPVIVESYTVLELDADFQFIAQYNLAGLEKTEGDEIEYVSITAGEGEVPVEKRPAGLQMTMEGWNAAGEDLQAQWIVAFTRLCDVLPFSDGDGISWSTFTNLVPPRPELCDVTAPAVPTAAPSSQPTSGPSSSPSLAPSAWPSGELFSAPSSSPSLAPSAWPSGQPSSAPSSSPSLASSAWPSGQPSSSPSVRPSSGRSSSPSSVPSASPSSSQSPTFAAELSASGGKSSMTGKSSKIGMVSISHNLSVLLLLGLSVPLMTRYLV